MSRRFRPVEANKKGRSKAFLPLVGIVLAVAHEEFVDMGTEKIRALGKPEHVLYDLKYVLTADEADLRL